MTQVDKHRFIFLGIQ